MFIYNYNMFFINIILFHYNIIISIISAGFNNCTKKCMEAGNIKHNFKIIRQFLYYVAM